MSSDLVTVHAHKDPEWDGVWAACPHCEHENSVTWAGKKTCNQCDGEFIVAAGPLVRTLTGITIEEGRAALKRAADRPVELPKIFDR